MLLDTTTGRATAASAPATAASQNARRTRGDDRTTCGSGRHTSTSTQLGASVTELDGLVRRTISAAATATNSRASAIPPLAVFHPATWSITPMPTPAINAAGRLCIPAMTAAASARSSSPGPETLPPTKPGAAPTNTAVSTDRAPATPHASADERSAGTPISRAADRFAADARSRNPLAVRVSHAHTAITATGPMASIAEVAWPTWSAPRSNVGSPGGSGKRTTAAVPATADAVSTSTWPSPRVATTLISRGTSRSRRTTATCAIAPTTTPRSSASGSAAQ